MSSATTITDGDFDEVIRLSDVPVLVDFWAEWCGPCKVIAPILDEIAEQNAARLKVAKLNVDDNQKTAMRFEVLSIPTLILFKDGEAQLRIVGAQPKSALLARLEPLLPTA
jgi:thioredoxin 1